MTEAFDFNFNPPTPEEQARQDAEREARLARRALVRAENQTRPRCAGCGADMPICEADNAVTEAQMQDEGYSYLRLFDYRVGDLICFWCLNDMTQIGEIFHWGRA